MKTSSNKIICAICGMNEQRIVHSHHGHYLLNQCGNCKLIYLDQVEVEATNFYDDVNDKKEELEYWGFPSFFTKYKMVFDYFFNERYQRIIEVNPPAGDWLDIGSGYGLWQSFLKVKNPQVNCQGIEIEKKSFEYSKSINLDVKNQSIEEFTFEKKYSVITICDVLEHVVDPQLILNKCYEGLLPGGVLYIQVPNVIGLKIPYGDGLGLPHHLWQFAPATLKKLVVNSSFKNIKYWTGVQGVIKYYELGGPTLIQRILFSFAKIMKIGNRLQLLAKK